MAVPSSGDPVRSEAFEEHVRGEAAEEPVRGEAEDLFRRTAEPPPEPSREVDHDLATPQPLDETREKAKTIDDEPELVAELAEPGAEDGASAELEVDQPWDGYEDQTADEVVARIGEVDAAVLAVLELYERSHKDRRTVLGAAERRRRELANAPS